MTHDSRRESLMNKVQMYAFVAHECALYLDCHPDNRQALEKFQKARDKMNEVVAQYEEMYGPLTAFSAGSANGGWNWISGKWPWQNKED